MFNIFKNSILAGIITILITIGSYLLLVTNINSTIINGLCILLLSFFSLYAYILTYYSELDMSSVFSWNFLEKIKTFSQEKTPWYLWIIIIVFVYVKLILQNYTWVSVESDLVHYDAKMFLDGLIPYQDFISREPYLLYISSFFLYIFWNISTELYLNFYIIFSVGSILMLYQIGKVISDKKLWLVLASLFVVAPFLIKFPSANYQFYGAIYLFCISVSIYYLLKGLKTKQVLDFFLVGFSIGITIWIYRGSIPFIVIISFLATFLLLKEQMTWWEILKRNLVIFSGLSISLVPPIWYYSSVFGFEWFNIILSSKFLIIIYILYLPVFLGTYLYYKFAMRNKYFQNILFIVFMSILVYMFFFTIADNTSVKEKIATVNDYIRHLWYFLFPALLLWVRFFIEFIFPKLSYKKWAVFIINILIFWVILYGANHVLRGTSFELNMYHLTLMFGLLIVYIFHHFYMLEKLAFSDIPHKNEIFIVTMFILIYLCGNLFYVDWIETYVINFVIPSIIIAGIFFQYILKHLDFWSKYILVLLWFYSFTAMYYINYNIVESSDLRKTSVNEIVSYIEKHTNKDDIIFTANPTFAFRSERKLALNLSHPLVYIKNPPYFHDFDPYNLVPPISKVISYIEKNKIKYIIGDSRTKALFISTRHEHIQEYILQNYILETTIDGVEIYRRK